MIKKISPRRKRKLLNDASKCLQDLDIESSKRPILAITSFDLYLAARNWMNKRSVQVNINNF